MSIRTGDEMEIEGGGWAQTPGQLLYDNRLSSTAKTLYSILVFHINGRTGACFPGFERLSLFMGMSARSLYRPMKELEDNGWVVRRRRNDRFGHRTSDSYLIRQSNPTAKSVAEVRSEVDAQLEALSRNRALGETARNRVQARESASAKRAESRGYLEGEDLEGEENPARVESTENAGRGLDEVPPPDGDGARVELTDDSPAATLPPEPVARGRKPRGSVAAQQNASLFGSEDSSAGADDGPPDSAGPPRRSPAAGGDDPDFLRFWSLAPTYAVHRATRKAAYESWRKARRQLTAGALLAAFEVYVAEWATWTEDEWQFIPKATTWLDNERWTEPVKPRRRSLSPVEGGGGSRGSRPRGGAQTDEERREIMRQAAAEIMGGDSWPPSVDGRVVVESTATHHRPRRSA